MTGRDARLRLFVAAVPPPAFLSALLAHLGPVPAGWRAVPAGQHHLTVHFVGTVSAPEAARCEQTLRHAAAGIGRFSVQAIDLASVPPAGPPAVLIVRLNAPPELLELHRRLASRLSRRPGGKDDYQPHLTVARRVAGSEPGPIPAIDLRDLPPWEVGSVRLVRSKLTPTGAEHASLAEVSLGSAGRLGR